MTLTDASILLLGLGMAVEGALSAALPLLLLGAAVFFYGIARMEARKG